MKPTITMIRDAVERAQSRAKEADIESIHFDSVVSVLAVFDLLNNNGGEATTDYPLIQFEETFGEWVKRFRIETHFDRFLAGAFYLMEREGRQEFTTTDIAQMYDRAYWKKPANLADVFAKSAQRFYFAPVLDKDSEEGLKRWKMTRSGYERIQDIQKEIDDGNP